MYDPKEIFISNCTPINNSLLLPSYYTLNTPILRHIKCCAQLFTFMFPQPDLSSKVEPILYLTFVY